MSWLSIISGLIKLANVIAGLIDRAQAREAGRNEVLVKSLTELTRKLGVMDAIRAETAKMSDEELDRELREC